MKNVTFNLILVAVMGLFLSVSLAAQDDMYYQPGDGTYYSSNSSEDENDEYYTENYHDENDDYDYYYSSRIRRFHRTNRGFGFYNNYYVNDYFYDPFNAYGSSIYVYNSYRRYRPWGYRNHHFNSWAYNRPVLMVDVYNNYGGNTWGQYPFYSYGNACGGNNFYNNFYNNNFGGGYYNSGYNNGGYYGNNYATNNYADNQGIHYGPRKYGSAKKAPRATGSRSRRLAPTKAPGALSAPGLRTGPGKIRSGKVGTPPNRNPSTKVPTRSSDPTRGSVREAPIRTPREVAPTRRSVREAPTRTPKEVAPTRTPKVKKTKRLRRLIRRDRPKRNPSSTRSSRPARSNSSSTRSSRPSRSNSSSTRSSSSRSSSKGSSSRSRRN